MVGGWSAVWFCLRASAIRDGISLAIRDGISLAIRILTLSKIRVSVVASTVVATSSFSATACMVEMVCTGGESVKVFFCDRRYGGRWFMSA